MVNASEIGHDGGLQRYFLQQSVPLTVGWPHASGDQPLYYKRIGIEKVLRSAARSNAMNMHDPAATNHLFFSGNHADGPAVL